MTQLSKYVLLLFVVCMAGHSTAQLNHRYDFRYLDQSDGLLHTEIKSIGQDARGFIWVLTQNGLQRYDGSRFVSYPAVLKMTPYNVMAGSNMYIDTAKNYVYIIKDNQVTKLDLTTNHLTLLNHEEWMKEGEKSSVFTTQNNDTWEVNSYGLRQHTYSNSQKDFRWVNRHPGQNEKENYFLFDSITGLCYTHDFNTVLIGDPKTGIMYSVNDSVVRHPFLLAIKEMGKEFSSIKSLMIDSYRQLWVVTWTDFLFKYDLDKNKLSYYLLKDLKNAQTGVKETYPNLLITSIFEDRQRKLWLSTENFGLILYDHATDQFNYLIADNNIRNGIRYNFRIATIFQDRQDNIWLGTDKGISIFNPSRNYFQSIHHIEGNDRSLPRYDINDVIETSQGEIMVATWGGGITFYDRNLKFIRNHVFKGTYEVNLVWSFVERQNGIIWAGAQHGFIHEYDPTTKTFRTLAPPETEFSTIRIMEKDKDGNILMGLHNGRVTVWNETEQKFYSYKDNPKLDSVRFIPVIDMLVDNQNKCWVATDIDLKEFDPSNYGYTAVHDINITSNNMSVTLQGLEQLNDSVLMIGSLYGGLQYFHKHTGRLTSVDNQYDDESVFAIKKDKQNQIWFTTNYSLHRLDQKRKRYTKFTINQDLINAPFGGNKIYELKDGRWMTFTPTELISFDPIALGHSGSLLPKVEISEFSVFDQIINIDSFLAYDAPLELSYQQNFITINFSALDFTKLTEINYYYRLAGVDKKWNHSHGKNFATYTDLKPGDYVFEVRSENGFSSSPITSFSFSVAAPWWATWWLKALVVCCLFAIALSFFRIRIKAIRQEASLKHKIAETEMMALRSQMNPHFIFNCINGIDAMIQSNDKYKATMYLNKFAKLIRNILDSSKQYKIPLSKDLETLQLYIDLELFRHHGKFTASIQADDDLLQNDYVVPPLIIQPYVENAILHGLRHRAGNGGKLDVTVRKSNEHIIYTIEDNGVGRKNLNGNNHHEGPGYGMQIGNDRVRLFNKEEMASVNITDRKLDGEPSGTCVEVKLRIH